MLEIPTQFNSRKVVLLVVLLMVATVAFSFGMATFAEWASFTQWMFGIYAGANIAAKGANRISLAIGNGDHKKATSLDRGRQ